MNDSDKIIIPDIIKRLGPDINAPEYSRQDYGDAQEDYPSVTGDCFSAPSEPPSPHDPPAAETERHGLPDDHRDSGEQKKDDPPYEKYLIAAAIALFICLAVFIAITSPSLNGGNILLSTKTQQAQSRTAYAQRQSPSGLQENNEDDGGRMIPERNAPSAGEADGGKVNINTASAEQLCSLPGIGEVLSRTIIEYRELYGDFKSVNELINVEGIGEKKLEAIAGMATV